MVSADNRRVPGWRVLREYLAENDSPSLFICNRCNTLIRSLPALMFDSERSEDASGEPHSITHAPEALRYALMSRQPKTPPKAKNRFTASVYAFDEKSEREDEFEVFFGR